MYINKRKNITRIIDIYQMNPNARINEAGRNRMTMNRYDGSVEGIPSQWQAGPALPAERLRRRALSFGHTMYRDQDRFEVSKRSLKDLFQDLFQDF